MASVDVSHRYAVILAGGRGERFWPLSTRARPKQFVSIFGSKPLVQHAIDRLKGLLPAERIFIITSADLVETTRATAKQLPPENIIGEPMGRDTAAAVALACGIVMKHDPKGVAAILTADQLMTDTKEFRQVLADCYSIAYQRDAIVTIGIAPTAPATSFGYIETGKKVPGRRKTTFAEGMRFVEKPDAATAQSYLETGRFLWNAGMFIWRAEVMAAAFKAHAKDLAPIIQQVVKAKDLTKWMEKHYPKLRKISIDFAVMEKVKALIVAYGDFGWDDVGSWPSIESHFPSDEQDNIALGAYTALESRSNIVVTEGTPRHTALLGVDDLIVVQTPSVTLICPKEKAQELKKLVAQLPPELT